MQQTTKVNEIKDRFGHTRYKVALTDYCPDGRDDLRRFDSVFQVTVVGYGFGDEDVQILTKEFGEYSDAERFFEETTGRYASLVKAENLDVQDIAAYADRINYRKVSPECCATCRWSRPCCGRNSLFDDWSRSLRGRFYCVNSDQFMPRKGDRTAENPRFSHGEEELRLTDIHPVVDHDGLCDGYERRKK